MSSIQNRITESMDPWLDEQHAHLNVYENEKE